VTHPGTVAEALSAARAAGLERLDAQMLLAHVLARPRSWLLAHGDEALSAVQCDRLAPLIVRRAAGEPVAYLVGEKAFHGLVLQVDSRVLVPRPDTEVLVDWAIELLSEQQRPQDVIDLGTGSGAVALAVRDACPNADVTATDISADALAVASANAQQLGLRVSFRSGAWWAAVAGMRFDLALANPPYIASADPHLANLTHEPLLALTPGGNGLSALHEIIDSGPEHLHPGAWLLLEHGWDQAAAVAARLQARGFTPTQTRRDLGGQARCTGGQWPASRLAQR
jgi:release factor glutamine methyltransferase